MCSVQQLLRRLEVTPHRDALLAMLPDDISDITFPGQKQPWKNHEKMAAVVPRIPPS